MDINGLTTPDEEIYTSPVFQKLIEDHLTFLRNKDVVIIDLTNTQCVKYRGDFYGLLFDVHIERKYHYTVMRVNNFLSPADFTGNISQIIVPSLTQIDMLKNILQTSKDF